MQINKVDVTLHPRKALQDGVKMIPSIQAGDRMISGLFLSKEKIRSYLNQL